MAGLNSFGRRKQLQPWQSFPRPGRIPQRVIISSLAGHVKMPQERKKCARAQFRFIACVEQLQHPRRPGEGWKEGRSFATVSGKVPSARFVHWRCNWSEMGEECWTSAQWHLRPGECGGFGWN